MKIEDWQNGGFGIYLHWPFCQSKCPYCDFNSHVADAGDMTLWGDAFESEIKRLSAETPNRIVNTVFFGGGTPSLMPPALVGRILDAIAKHWTLSNQPEITLEANPGSVEAAKFEGFAQAGVNRVSMGVQALNDTDLRRLGRLHTAQEAMKAFEIARNQFARVSFDLIYARQNQSPKDWETELKQALALSVDHLSLYQLTIESGTRFGDLYEIGKLRGLPEDDGAAQMYQIAQDLCEDAGMPAYEVSNHAAPGQESRHNLIYWRYGDYAGIGPGAHGRLSLKHGRVATSTPLLPQNWLNAALNGNGELPRETLSGSDQAIEYLMMCLRLREGANMGRFMALGGVPMNNDALEMLTDQALLDIDGDIIRATARGRVLLNAMLRELLSD